MPKKKQENGAVLYVRVSTDEQANGPLNLVNQENRCRNFCVQKGLPVLKVFVDSGESARTAERPEFQKMLKYCKANRRKVAYVVVQDLSRFARNVQDQAAAIYELGRNGIMLRSTYEPNIDESAAGSLAANIYGAFHQYFSDSLSERMKERTRQAVSAGRFPWKAPIGYLNTGAKDGPNIKPDPIRASLIRRAFELVSSGLYKKTDVLRIVTDEGLKTARGKRLAPQTFHALLQNSLYAGWVRLPSDESFMPVRGLHEAIVNQELFDGVKRILSGRRPSATSKHKFNPDLPLKRIVRCEDCGASITGGLSKGRTKKYGHYWCRTKGCRAVKLRKEKLEGEFIALLKRLRPSKGITSAFPKVAAQVWAGKQGESDKQIKRLEKSLEDKKLLKRQLLEDKLRGEVTLSDYTEASRQYTTEIATIEAELREVQSSLATSDAFLRFAELQLMDIAGAWLIAGPDQRERVQNLLFQEGLVYSKTEGILNRSKSCLFSVLESTGSENGLLASPTGFEPVLSP
jgi:site-specific DNA recombinase